MTDQEPRMTGPVIFAGENPLIILYRPGSDELVGVASLWHATYTAAGAGNSLVIWLDPDASGLGETAPTGIYTDNADMARLVWQTLNRRWDPLLGRGLEEASPQPARFTHQSAGQRLHRITCGAGTTTIELLWHDGEEPFYTVTYPYEYEVSAVIMPCPRATISVNGEVARGEIRPHADVFRSSAVVAFCETWIGR
jgi:hypothetical protein